MADTGRGPREIFWSIVRSVRRRWQRHTRFSRIGHIDWGDLRSRAPVSRDWGFDRGKPIDRYYIEQFLESRDVPARVFDYRQPRGNPFGGTKSVVACIVRNWRRSPEDGRRPRFRTANTRTIRQ